MSQANLGFRRWCLHWIMVENEWESKPGENHRRSMKDQRWRGESNQHTHVRWETPARMEGSRQHCTGRCEPRKRAWLGRGSTMALVWAGTSLHRTGSVRGLEESDHELHMGDVRKTRMMQRDQLWFCCSNTRTEWRSKPRQREWSQRESKSEKYI